MKFINEDFLLQTRTAARLYHQFAESEPIFDYHCHLSPHDIAENRQFKNLFEIWLEGDHYKWRAMRANGVAERYCTGEASPFEKFEAWAATVPHTLRNPLYHWTHLELKRYFGIDDLLDEKSAARIWKKAGQQLATPGLSAQGILKRFNVVALCTTDDRPITWHTTGRWRLPTWRLGYSRPSGRIKRWRCTCRPNSMRGSSGLNRRPMWKSAAWYSSWKPCRRAMSISMRTGCRLSDHGLAHCYSGFCSPKAAAAIFARARRGRAASPAEQGQFAAFMMLFFGRLDAEKGWTKQLHLGPLRNNNTRLLRKLGPDTGFDSIGDYPQGTALGGLSGCARPRAGAAQNHHL